MTKDAVRKQRIAAASETKSVLGSLGRMKNDDHRTAMVHDRLVEAVDNICRPGDDCECPFTPEQVECLKELAFHIAHVVDPQTKPRIWSKLRHDFSEASWVVKLPIILTGLGVLVAAITAAVKLVFWFYTPAIAEQQAPAPVSIEQRPNPDSAVPLPRRPN